jgi:ABC-2 type transport system ATP-binding protein
MLSLRDVRKRFGTVEAVAGISFDVPSGSAFGLLGPNGAGKTTTISMIVGCLDPDAGSLTLDGAPIGLHNYDTKRRVGFVPQELAIYDDLDALDNLRFFGALCNVTGAELQKASDRVLEIVGLTDRAKDPARTYSGGMKRRLNLAAALLHKPSLLVLDEPTVGVDPQSRNAIFESLEAIRIEGTTLLYTTHYMEEVERLCDHVAVMDHGKVIACDTLNAISKLVPTDQIVVIELEEGSQGLLGNPPVPFKRDGDRLEADLQDLNRDLPALLTWLQSQGIRYSGVRSQEASLESVFLHLTGRTLRD